MRLACCALLKHAFIVAATRSAHTRATTLINQSASLGDVGASAHALKLRGRGGAGVRRKLRRERCPSAWIGCQRTPIPRCRVSATPHMIPRSPVLSFGLHARVGAWVCTSAEMPRCMQQPASDLRPRADLMPRCPCAAGRDGPSTGLCEGGLVCHRGRGREDTLCNIPLDLRRRFPTEARDAMTGRIGRSGVSTHPHGLR